MNTVNKQELKVTVSRLPESIIEEMENYFEAVFDENELDGDHLQTLRMIVIGYGAAWDALSDSLSDDRLSEANATIRLRADHYEADAQSVRAINDRIRAERDRLRAALIKAESFISRITAFCGQGLVVHNWHQNGDGEPWDNFFDENMDGDELELIRAALSTTTEPTEPTESTRIFPFYCMECDSETHQNEHCHICGSKHVIIIPDKEDTNE